MREAAFIEVEAGVRYWEDARVNYVTDEDGSLIPFRSGDCWCPNIDLRTGKVVGWPEGVEADIHYKVCDAGRYWLLDEAGERIAERDGYVPGDYLCHGDNGYGDYIIMTIDGSGAIANYRRPPDDKAGWSPIPE